MTEEEKKFLGTMTEEEKKLMGERIKSCRKNIKLTQDGLAEKFGMKRTNITNYEAGRVIPPGNILRDLSVIFGVTTDYLLGKSEISNCENSKSKIETIAAHIDDDVTEEELENIQNYIEFIKSQRK